MSKRKDDITQAIELRSLLLRNCRVIDPLNKLDGMFDLLLRDGRIAEVVAEKQCGALSPDCMEIDASGLWVVPGLIDMHVHLREPGQEYKEDVASGTMAAAAGGFTAVACMPNTTPVNDSRAVTAQILAAAANAPARVYPVGCISKGSGGEELADYGELKSAGVVALSDDGQPVVNAQMMRRALEYSGNFGLPLISHAEDVGLSKGGAMNEGEMAIRLGLRGIPVAAESVAVYRDLALAGLTRRPVHIAHVSTGEAVSLIRRAKELGQPVTAETAPHYFTLTDKAVAGYDTNAKMSPPLRSETDRQEIVAGLVDGTIDVIATDHAPHSLLEKELEFDQAANGIIGLQTAVSLTLQLVHQGIISPTRMVELLSVNPARILGVEGGSLTPGVPADITVIDPAKSFVFTAESVLSKSRNSPFLGMRFIGKPVLTILRGKITYNDLG
ncbi:MAG: dihydroorotase [Desulfobulbaceae bacterium]|nr:dihydroorotase [Desulfobulbaceae bacterium]